MDGGRDALASQSDLECIAAQIGDGASSLSVGNLNTQIGGIDDASHLDISALLGAPLHDGEGNVGLRAHQNGVALGQVGTRVGPDLGPLPLIIADVLIFSVIQLQSGVDLSHLIGLGIV